MPFEQMFCADRYSALKVVLRTEQAFAVPDSSFPAAYAAERFLSALLGQPEA